MNIENLDKAKLAEACQTALNVLRSLYGKLERDANDFEPDALAEDLLNRPEFWPLSLLRVALGKGDELDVQMAQENWKDGEYIGEDVDAEEFEDDDFLGDDDEDEDEEDMMNESDDRPNHCPRCERWVSDEDFVSYHDKCEMCCLDVD